MTKGIILGFLCFILFIILHIYIFHNFRIKRYFFSMVKISFLVLLIYIMMFLAIPEENLQRNIESFLPISLIAFFTGAFLHLFFGYFYLYFIQIVDRSPCTRILVEIENSPQKKLSLEQIKQRFSIDKKIGDELEDMVILGRLNKDSEFYIVTQKGRLHCKIFKFIREYLKLRKC